MGFFDLLDRNAARHDARSRFSVRPTGQRSEFADFTLSDAVLPNGWYLIVANRWAERQGISMTAEVLMAFVEEHVMVSGAVKEEILEFPGSSQNKRRNRWRETSLNLAPFSGLSIFSVGNRQSQTCCEFPFAFFKE